MAMLRGLLLLFIIFSMVNAQSKKCPNGWTNYGRCYKFFPQTFNWVAAQRNCQTFGADLVSVHSKVENDFLLSLLPSSNTRVWAGAHDGEVEGQWLWTDGTPYGFTHWCPGEPNNKQTENCLEINLNSERCWNDVSCYTSLASICVLTAL